MEQTAKTKTLNILRHYNLRANKKLGQNFLINDGVLAEIERTAEIQPEDIILEIGPGIGILTERLVQSGCRKVIAVELDRRMQPILGELVKKHDNLEVIYQDILQVDLQNIVGGCPFKVVANLPYYITTPIIMHFLESNFNYERLLVMVQNEVAQRMASTPSSKAYGALSIAVQYRTEAQLALKVMPESFIPQPSVDSAIIVCKRRAQPAVQVQDEELFFRIVKAAFSQRRKVIANSLKNIGLTGEQTQVWLQLAGIDEKRRAETLSLEEFAALEKTYDKW